MELILILYNTMERNQGQENKKGNFFKFTASTVINLPVASPITTKNFTYWYLWIVYLFHLYYYYIAMKTYKFTYLYCWYTVVVMQNLRLSALPHKRRIWSRRGTLTLWDKTTPSLWGKHGVSLCTLLTS